MTVVKLAKHVYNFNKKTLYTLSSAAQPKQLYNLEPGSFKGIYLRNGFRFSVVHRSMNTTGLEKSKHTVGNSAWDPLCSYFDEKEIIHLFHFNSYLHFVFTLFLFHICAVLM